MKPYQDRNENRSQSQYIGSWVEIPDDDLLNRILASKTAQAEAKAYHAALNQYIKEGSHGSGESYFQAIDHKAEIEIYLSQPVDFDEPLPITVNKSVSTNKVVNKPSLTQEQLLAEIDKLIDRSPTEAQLNEILPFLAKLAGIQSRDAHLIYQTNVAELDSQNPDELRHDLNELLAIGIDSLNLDEFLPSPLATPLVRIAGRMAIRPEAFLLTLLAAVSSLHKVGTDLTISAEDKFIVPPTLFTGVVAESGQKKSPLMRLLVKYPLDSLEWLSNETVKLTYEQALDEYHALSKEEQKECFPEGEPKFTPIDYYFTDGTVEGVNRQFERFPERSMLYLRDELAGVFAFDKYRNGKGTERQDFLSFYDGFGKKELRADGFASRVKQAQISIFGTIQPDILCQLMTDPLAADGQWARFLFVIQPLQPATLQSGTTYDINSELLNPLYKKIDRLPVTHYKLSTNAYNFYEKCYNQLEIKRTTHPDPAMRAVYSKAEGTIGRLAINLHVLHECVNNGSGQVSETIPSARIVQACKLMKFFINQIKLIDASVRAGTDSKEIAPSLVAIVERSRLVGAVTARDIKMSIRLFRNVDTSTVRNLFRQLEELGYGECSGSGRKLKFTASSTTV